MKVQIMGLVIFLTTIVAIVVCRKGLGAHLNGLSGSQMLADILMIVLIIVSSIVMMATPVKTKKGVNNG